LELKNKGGESGHARKNLGQYKMSCVVGYGVAV